MLTRRVTTGSCCIGPRVMLFAVVALLALDLLATPGQARTWLVLADGSGHAPTIQAAVDSATTADTVLVGPGTYLESVVIHNKGLTAHSVDGRERTTVQGNPALRLSGSAGRACAVSGFTFMAPSGTGVVTGSQPRPTFDSCAFTACANDGAEVQMDRSCTFAHCSATGNGGAGLLGSSIPFTTIVALDCEIRGNHVGVIGRAELTGCVIADNTASGVLLDSYSWSQGPRVTLRDCAVTGNGGYGLQGQAFTSYESTYIEAFNTLISGNATGAFAGGPLASTFYLEGCELSSNGGTSSAPGMELVRCTVWGNAGGLRAPAAGANPGSVRLEECTYHANQVGISASSPGAGAARITVTRSIVSGTLSGRGVPQCGHSALALLVECSDLFQNAGGDEVCPGSGTDNLSADPLYCNAPDGNLFLRADSPCVPASSPCGQLIGALPVGCLPTAIEPGAASHHGFAVGPNLPNPFSPSTTISFTLPGATAVVVRVYDVHGRIVRTLIDRPLAAGDHLAAWDGRDAAGRPAAAGIYYCRIEGGARSATRAMVLVR